jgi:hypothetical protein
MRGGRMDVIDELLRMLEKAIVPRFNVLSLNLLVDAGKTLLYNPLKIELNLHYT